MTTRKRRAWRVVLWAGAGIAAVAAAGWAAAHRKQAGEAWQEQGDGTG